jgi:hypothetical protein
VATSATIPQVQAALLEQVDRKFEKIRGPEQIIQNLFPFDSSGRIGDKHVQPTRMSEEQGYHLRAAGLAAPTMNEPVAAMWEEAQFTGSILDYRSRIDIETLARTQSSTQAVIDRAVMHIEGLQESMMAHEEYSLLRGGLAMARMASISGTGTSRALVLQAGTYSVGWLARSRGMPIYAYSDAALTTTVPASPAADIVIASFNRTTGTLNVTGNAADLTTLDGAATSYLARKGEAVTVPGIIKRLAQTTGSPDNISLTTYPEWVGNAVAFGSTNISFTKILQGDALIAEFGLTKALKKLWCDPRNFAVLNADLSANRRFDGSYRRTKGENGFGAIEYYSPTGVIEVEVHPYCHGNEAVEITVDAWKRKGADDLTLQIPGDGTTMTVLAANSQQYEYRGFSLQGMFCRRPPANTVYSGITQPTI